MMTLTQPQKDLLLRAHVFCVEVCHRRAVEVPEQAPFYAERVEGVRKSMAVVAGWPVGRAFRVDLGALDRARGFAAALGLAVATGRVAEDGAAFAGLEEAMRAPFLAGAR